MRSRRRRTVDAATVVTGAVVAGFVLPIVFLAAETMARPTDALDIIFSSRTLGPLTRSLIVATASAISAGALGTGIAWVVTRTNVTGRRLWAATVHLPLVIPSFVGATALRFTFGAGGLVPFVPRLNGFVGAWLALTLFTYPYVYLPVAARLRALPGSLEDAARLLGSGPGRVFRKVLWPQMAPAVYAGSLLVFLYALSDFGAVSIMRYDTLTRAIFSARLAAPVTALSLGFVLALIALAVAAAQRSTARGRLVQGPARETAQIRRSSVGRWLVVVPAAAVGVGLVAPIAAFTVWWVRGTVAGSGGAAEFGETLLSLAGPAMNSAIAGIAAAVVAVAVLLPVAFVAARSRSWLGRAAALTTSATFALPGVVVAFAIVFWIVRAPDVVFSLYQTFPLLIAAYVIHFGAQALQTMTVAVHALPESLTDAAGTLGAGPARRLRTIQIPLMAPGLAAAGGLILLSVLKELPATLLLAPIGYATLATRVWGAAEEGFLAEAGAASLALVALSGLLSWFLVFRRNDG